MENKSSETTRSVARNVLYGFSTWLLPIGLNFYAIPKIVKALGDQDFGIYSLIFGFIAYSFNFSFGRSITKYIAEYRSKGENEKISGIISAAFFTNVLVGLLGIAVFCLSANWLVTDIFKIDPAVQDKTVTAFYLASLIIFVSMQNQIFSSILQGIHRFDVYSKVFNFNNVALILGNLLLVSYGYGLISLFVWNLIVPVISGLIFAYAAKKYLPEFQLKLNFGTENLKLIVYYSSAIIGYQFLSNALLLFERGLITRQLGAAGLTYYIVPLTISIYIHGFVASLVIVIFPIVSELKDNSEKLLRLYTKAIKTVCLIVFFFGTTLIAESGFFLNLWMDSNFADKSAALLVIHTITFSILAIQTVSWQMTEGLGYPSYNFYFFVICLLISVFLMVWLGERYGAFGFALGRMIGFSVFFFSIFYIEKRLLGKVQKALWLKVIGILTVASFVAAIIEILILKHFPLNWLTLIFAALSGGATYSLVIWASGYISEDEKILFRHLLKLPPKN